MKQFAKFCTILMVLIVVFSLCTTAYAAGSVSYDGDANKFVFSPGTKDSTTSLFENFQNVMPGDIITEQILIKNNSSDKIKIKVYMRSLGAQDGTDKTAKGPYRTGYDASGNVTYYPGDIVSGSGIDYHMLACRFQVAF